MQFLAVLALAASASAHYLNLPANSTISTVTGTRTITDTITNCATTVTDCPARSTVTTVYETEYTTTTICPISTTHAAPHGTGYPSHPVETHPAETHPSPSGPATHTPVVPGKPTGSAPVYPTHPAPQPNNPVGTAPHPTGTGAVTTQPHAPIATGAAGKMGASFGLVAAAVAIMAL